MSKNGDKKRYVALGILTRATQCWHKKRKEKPRRTWPRQLKVMADAGGTTDLWGWSILNEGRRLQSYNSHHHSRRKK